MKVAGGLLLLVASALAYDAVLFSSTTKITKNSPAVTSLISSATSDAPLVFFVNPSFVLGQFSKAAATYTTSKSDSSIVNAAKAARYSASRFISSTLSIPSASTVSAAATLQSGESIYLVSADSWSSLDKLAAEVLAVLGDKATVVVTNSNAVSADPKRVKRVSADDAANEKTGSFPIVMPDVTAAGDRQTCLFYLEGLNFVTKQGDKYISAQLRDDGTGSKKFAYTKPICSNQLALKDKQTAVFQFTITPGSPSEADKGWTNMGEVAMKLTFTSDTLGYWSLTGAELSNALTITMGGASVTAPAGPAQSKSLDYLALNSVFGYGWNCWDSQALFFGPLGISFHGIQVAVYGMDYSKDGNKDGTMSYFGSKVDSCTGTFSAASWMGIITALVLIAVFIFGFLMLNSVQTLDRYDDPKQKQILINVRE